MMEINAQYNVAKSGSLPVKLAAKQRRNMFNVFLRECGLPNPVATILDIGVTSDKSYEASNYLEKWYPHKNQITAAGIDDATFLEADYPGMKFVLADACNLHFADQSFDVVHSSAVIEHVGAFKNQVQMVSECARVSREFFFITTPNRWFPVEFHTILPLVHWLPKQTFRRLMEKTGRSFFADENNLNLMSRQDLLRATEMANIGNFDVQLKTVSLGRWPSNLLLIGTRT